MKTVIRYRWQTLDLTIPAGNTIKNRVEFKVPREMLTLEAVRVGAVNPAGAFPRPAIFGEPGKDFHLGRLSLHVNNKETHAFHWNVKMPKLQDLKRKFGTLKLDYQLENNSLIQGYYIDDNRSNVYPYVLRIYFKGKHQLEVSE